MSAAIPLRDDFDGPALRTLAKASKDANQTRRLLSLAVIYEGGRRSEAAAFGGVGLQIICDWVLRFNAEGPDGLIDRKPSGASPKLNDAQRRALCEIVENGPIPAIHGVVRWRLKDLVQALGGVPGLFGREHGEPRAQGAGLRQDLGTAAPPGAERVRERGF